MCFHCNDVHNIKCVNHVFCSFPPERKKTWRPKSKAARYISFVGKYSISVHDIIRLYPWLQWNSIAIVT